MKQMQIWHALTNGGKLSPRKVAAYVSLAVGAIVLMCVLVVLFFPDTYINGFLKGRITKAFAEAYPAYSIRIADMNYSVLKNRFGFDSVALGAVDGTFSCNMGPFSVSGIGWMHLLWGGNLAPNDFANSVVDAQDIVLDLPQSQYELRCGRLRVSVPDSEIVAEALELHPLMDDEQFFAGSKFRRTRFRLVIPRCRVVGSACVELLQGKIYCARSGQVNDAFLDVLVNMDKLGSGDSSTLLMPNEILSSMKETIQVDSLNIINGRLKYAERYAVGSEPAVIALDSIQIFAGGVANRPDRGDTAVIHAEGNFMKAGTMNVLMSFPLASPEFSFRYAGSLRTTMDLSEFNPWLVPEHVRVKSGVLQAATFEINVASGRASGNVRVAYRDLTIAAFSKGTGSEKGIVERTTSFLAKTFKIRGTNMPDASGSMKVGEVKYTRKRDDRFFRFVWSALRSGVGDVVGF